MYGQVRFISIHIYAFVYVIILFDADDYTWQVDTQTVNEVFSCSLRASKSPDTLYNYVSVNGISVTFACVSNLIMIYCNYI